jgi:AcrR family transcriptional regulator
MRKQKNDCGRPRSNVAQIADRAGLTRRTFSRYFTDKRDVLFAGSERLPGLLAETLRRADSELTPFEALLTAFADVGAVLGAQVALHAVERREVIARSPELQERGRTKFADVADALTAELVRRGSEPASATLLADIGVAIFRTGFNRWVDNPDSVDLTGRLREAGAELIHAVAPFSDG